MMVGSLLSFWDGIFSVAMLNFPGAYEGFGCTNRRTQIDHIDLYEPTCLFFIEYGMV